MKTKYLKTNKLVKKANSIRHKSRKSGMNTVCKYTINTLTLSLPQDVYRALVPVPPKNIVSKSDLANQKRVGLNKYKSVPYKNAGNVGIQASDVL